MGRKPTRTFVAGLLLCAASLLLSPSGAEASTARASVRRAVPIRLTVPTVDAGLDARRHALSPRRTRGGFTLTAAGVLPVIIGLLVSETTPLAANGAPLMATGLAMEAAGSALMLPWENLGARSGAASLPPIRVTVGWRQGLRIGVAGRF